MRITLDRPVTVNPLSSGASLGAVLAVLGIEGALPVFHGANGCSTFIRLELARHFREPIPLVATAVGETEAVLGGAGVLRAALRRAAEASPFLLAVIAGSLSEMSGEDLSDVLSAFRAERPDIPVILVPAADFRGGMLLGYAEAVTVLLRSFVEPAPVRPGTLAVLPPPGLTPGDLEALRDEIRAFGMTPLLLPDIGRSLGGNLGPGSPLLPQGGTSSRDLAALGSAEAVLCLGRSLLPAARELAERLARPLLCLDRQSGLTATDRRLGLLRDLSGRRTPASLLRERGAYLDALLDLHTLLAGRRVALAGNPETLLDLSHLLREAGLRPTLAVAGEESEILPEIPAERVLRGDLDLFGSLLTDEELLIAGSNARQAAREKDLPLLRLGFPVFDRYGATDRATLGYRGARSLLHEIANLLLERGSHP